MSVHGWHYRASWCCCGRDCTRAHTCISNRLMSLSRDWYALSIASGESLVASSHSCRNLQCSMCSDLDCFSLPSPHGLSQTTGSCEGPRACACACCSLLGQTLEGRLSPHHCHLGQHPCLDHLFFFSSRQGNLLGCCCHVFSGVNRSQDTQGVGCLHEAAWLIPNCHETQPLRVRVREFAFDYAQPAPYLVKLQSHCSCSDFRSLEPLTCELFTLISRTPPRA